MSLFIVTSDGALLDAINIAVEDHFIADDPLRQGGSTHILVDKAAAALLRAVERGDPPSAVVLDPKTRASSEAEGGVTTAGQWLEILTETTPDLPVVLAIHSAGTASDLQTILRPQVWGWDTTPDRKNPKAVFNRLAAVLRMAVAQPRQRRFCAVVQFKRDAELLSLYENGVVQFQERPLLNQTENGPKRQRLHSFSNKELEAFANNPSDADSFWDKFSNIGQEMFLHLFGDAGAALLAPGTADTLEFRFEISPDVLSDRFGLPLEFLSTGASRTEFLCRLRPIARRVGAGREARARDETKPHLLFLDAGVAQGHSDILVEREWRPTGFPPLTATATAQHEEVAALAEEGHCTLERWDLDVFRKANPKAAPGLTFKEALRRRLQEPRAEDCPADIVHFCGHGITPVGGETRLVLPGAQPRTVELLRVDEFASWLPKGVRLVFFGACQSVSVATARHLHADRECSVVGFRWEIRADRISEFVRGFYRAHVVQRRPVPAAYREACHTAASEENTVWAAAVALAAD